MTRQEITGKAKQLMMNNMGVSLQQFKDLLAMSNDDIQAWAVANADLLALLDVVDPGGIPE